MSNMFESSKFNGDISNWNVNKNCNLRNFCIYNIDSYEDFIRYKREIANNL